MSCEESYKGVFSYVYEVAFGKSLGTSHVIGELDLRKRERLEVEQFAMAKELVSCAWAMQPP